MSIGKTAIGIGRGERGEGIVLPDRGERRRVRVGAQTPGPAVETMRVFTAGARGGSGDEIGAGPCRVADVLRVDAAREIVPPRQEGVDPRGYGVTIDADGVDRKFAAPTIVPERAHRRFVPRVFVLAPVQQETRELLVTIGKAVGLDLDPVADDSFHREATLIDARCDRFDDCADATLGRDGARGFHRRYSSLSAGLSSRARVAASVRLRACACPCAGTGAARTPPKFPMPLPP